MNTDTPETDAMEYFDAMCNPHRVVEADFARKLERERDEWKAKYIQQNKDLGCELRDPNGTIWDHAKTLQRERDEARGQRDRLAAALINCMPFISGEGCGEYSDAKEALQSLTPNETLSNQ